MRASLTRRGFEEPPCTMRSMIAAVSSAKAAMFVVNMMLRLS